MEVEGRGCEKLTKISEVRKSLVETTMRTNFFGIGFEGIYTHYYSKHNRKSMSWWVKRPSEEPSKQMCCQTASIYIDSH